MDQDSKSRPDTGNGDFIDFGFQSVPKTEKEARHEPRTSYQF